jgi:hypothetical protein
LAAAMSQMTVLAFPVRRLISLVAGKSGLRAATTKLRDIVGLYVCPPDHAIVLSIDETSQIQALDRTQPGLPMKKGRAGTLTHDYKRHGTTTLFAALASAVSRTIFAPPDMLLRTVPIEDNCLQLGSVGGGQLELGSFVHSPDSHDQVRRGIRKRIALVCYPKIAVEVETR